MRKTILFSLCVTAAILLVSCDHTESDNPMTINLDGSTKMRIAMRVNPELGINTGDVTISKGDMVYSQPLEFDNGNASVLFSDLQPGIWLVEVELRDEDDYVLYQGSGEAGVVGGQTNTATIVLEELSGDLEVVIELPEDWDDSTLRIVSDASWRVSGTLVPGWETVAFDDSSWELTDAPAPVNCGTVHFWDDPDVFTMWSEVQHETVYLRKSFSLESNTTVVAAIIKTASDDDHDLYINGELVASDWDVRWGPTLTTDISEYLQPGTNIIAIEACDSFGGCRWMCVDATVSLHVIAQEILFSDDFENGADDAWVPIIGEWSAADGRFNHVANSEDYTAALTCMNVAEPSWVNYEVELVAYPDSDDHYDASVYLRVMDSSPWGTGNPTTCYGVFYKYWSQGHDFRIIRIVNGVQTTIAGGSWVLDFSPSCEISAQIVEEASGTRIIADLNAHHLEVLDESSARPAYGGIGLRGWFVATGQSVDNISVFGSGLVQIEGMTLGSKKALNWQESR